MSMRILSVQIDRMIDDSPDLSYLGKYSNEPGPDDRTIDRQERGDMRRNEFRYFIAALSGDETGNPESVLQDYNRMESYNRGEWSCYGIAAVARVQLSSDTVQRITSGGLWGIESDSDDSYFAGVNEEQLAELRTELLALGFTEGEVSVCDVESVAGC